MRPVSPGEIDTGGRLLQWQKFQWDDFYWMFVGGIGRNLMLVLQQGCTRICNVFQKERPVVDH